jgi:hypothetical protein
LALSSFIAASGCAAAIDSGSFVDHAANFSRYRTYNWTSSESRVEEPFSSHPEFPDRFEGEVEKQLAAKGFSGPTRRQPDLLVRYRATAAPRLEVTNLPGYGSCVGAIDCDTRIRETDTATLVLDVLDARSRKVVWRGWARDDVDDLTGGRSNDAMRRAVAQMMEKLPARADGEEHGQ